MKGAAMRIVMVVALWLLVSAATAAEEAVDTPASREVAAERYAKTADLAQMFDQMADQMSRNVPEAQRDVFESAMKKHLRVDMLEAAMKAAMVKHFTTQELDALADFYGSPVGKSAMAKLAVYTADLQPLMVAEVQRAVTEAVKERQATSSEKPAGT
ncbi:MAG: DUF2059 domain-containing protein [Steroidobacteraceae bacterium]